MHAFGFSLLTALVLPACARWRYGACLGWFVVNAVFEFGQDAAGCSMAGYLDGFGLLGHSDLHRTADQVFALQGSFGSRRPWPQPRLARCALRWRCARPAQ